MGSWQTLFNLLHEFPALGRLGAGLRPRRIRPILQNGPAECGAACLAMVLAYHGREVSLGELRERTGTDRDGVNALSLVEAARAHGLRARGVQIEDVNDLRYLPTASILHLEFNHFVVLQRFRPDAVEVLDPAAGERLVPMNRFRKSFTGVALVFEAGDQFQPTPGETKRVRPYVREILRHSQAFSRLFFTSLLIQIFALALPVLTRALIDQVVPQGDYDLLQTLGVGLAGVVLFSFLASLIRAHLLLQLRTRLDAQMTLSFLEHLLDLPYAFFQRRSAGDLMMRLNSNAAIREILTAGVLSGMLDGMLVIVILIVLWLTSPGMCALIVGLGVLQMVVFWVTRRPQRRLMAEELHAQARSQSYQVELFSGIETLKASGSEPLAAEHWSHLFVDVLNVSLSRGRLSALAGALVGALGMASPLLILCVGAHQAIHGGMTLGELFQVNALAGAFLGPLSALVNTALQLTLVRSYIERIEDVLETDPEQDTGSVVRAHALQGRITLEGVSFRYGARAPLVVKNVSVAIRSGQQVAMVGRSGSGKSTLARLLIGLYPPTEGRILFDGVDLSGLDYRSVRRQVGLVPQNPYLFATTIRSNIALANPRLSLEAVQAAARLAHVHEDILVMPMRYDTLLSDGGASLSGGQRQRIALARALVEKPTILVLDEATSDLDTVTESAIQRELEALACTRIVIAHRLSTIVHADLILVLKGGEIVERGTHSELVALGGEYAELVSAQMDRRPHAGCGTVLWQTCGCGF